MQAGDALRPRVPRAPAAALTGSLVVATAAALVLAGCTPTAPTKTAAPKPASSPSSAATAPPKLIIDGTAKGNLPYFDEVNQKLIAGGGDLHGRAFIDNLVKAGFVKAAMELTPDTTSVGLAADNIQFSVKFNGACLIGQYGNIGYASFAAPVLATGTCLIGKTRTIDW